MSLKDCTEKTLKPWPILVDHYKFDNHELLFTLFSAFLPFSGQVPTLCCLLP